MSQRLAPSSYRQPELKDPTPPRDTRAYRSGSGQRGMTLVEILVVLALIGVAALVVVTNMQTIIRRYELESGVREITAFVNDAPSQAKEISAPVFLVWDAANRTFSIARDAAATTVLETMQIPVELTFTAPAAPVLRCDVYSRAFIGTSTTMMTAVQTMAISHAYTNDESAPTYVLTLSPLWAVEVSR